MCFILILILINNEHTSDRQAPVTVWKNSGREQRQYDRYATGLCDTFIM